MAAGVPRVTARQPPDAVPAPAPGTVFGDGFGSIVRAAWREATLLSKVRAERELIGFDQPE